MKKLFFLTALLVQGLITNLNAATLTASLVVPSSTAGQFVPANGGAPNATKATFKISATGGATTISEMKFTVNSVVPATVTDVRVGNVHATPVSEVAYLTGLALQVPNGGSGLDVEAYISYAPVGVNGVPSGTTSTLALTYIKYVSIETATVSVLNTNIEAPTMKLVGSSPSITVTSSSSELVPGTVEVARVTTAATKGAITLNALPINALISNAQLTSGGGGVNGIIVKDASGNPVTTSNTAFSSTTAGGTSTITFVGSHHADTAQTFKIYLVFDSTNFNGSPPVAHSATMSIGLGPANLFSWTDTAGGGITPITKDNKVYFYNYPFSTVSVSGGTVANRPLKLELWQGDSMSIQLGVQGARVGGTYLIQGTVDLKRWKDLVSLTAPAERFVQAIALTEESHKFFRLMEIP